MSSVKPITKQLCDHCGTPHYQGDTYSLRVGGVDMSMCCPGCQSVAEMIEQIRVIADTKTSIID